MRDQSEISVKQGTVAKDSYRLFIIKCPCNGKKNTRLNRRTTAKRLVLIVRPISMKQSNTLKTKVARCDHSIFSQTFQDNASDIHFLPSPTSNDVFFSPSLSLLFSLRQDRFSSAINVISRICIYRYISISIRGYFS